MYRTAFFALLAAHAFSFESFAQTPPPSPGPGKATDKAPPGAPHEPTGWSGSQTSGDPKPDPADLWTQSCEQGRGFARSLCRRLAWESDGPFIGVEGPDGELIKREEIVHFCMARSTLAPAVPDSSSRSGGDDQRESAEKSSSAIASTRDCISSKTLISNARRPSTPRVA